MMGRLVVGKDQVDAVLEKEPPERPFVLGLSASVCEPRSKLTHDDERERNRFRFLEERHRPGDASAEIDIAIGVDRNSHRQSFLSTRSCAASAPVTALSAFHVPAMSLRFRRLRGASVVPAPSASASMVASFKLLPPARARWRRAASRAAGMPRTVYCMHTT